MNPIGTLVFNKGQHPGWGVGMSELFKYRQKALYPFFRQAGSFADC
jgi:hypothetical protein